MISTRVDAAIFHDANAAAAEWAIVAPVMAGEVFPGRMRVVDGDGKYGAKRRKPLPAAPPTRPAAVELFDTATGTARVLAIDIDATVYDARVAAEHAAAVASILRGAGFHPWIDASESGGLHVIACLPHRVGQKDIVGVVRAMRATYPSIDTAPVAGLHGCLRPTGSRHRLGGWQRHLGTLDELHDAVTTPPATNAWERLRAAFPPETAPTVVPEQRSLPGLRLQARDIGEILHRQAVNGPTKAIHVADQSRLRYRIERAAIEAGFTEDEFVHAVMTQWTWLKASYARKGPAARIATDHLGYAAAKTKKKHQGRSWGKSSSRNLDTSHPQYPRPRPIPPDLLTRKWLTHGRQVARGSGLGSYDRWLVVVVAAFAMWKRSLKVDAGLRAYALGCGMSHEQVRQGLIRLAELGLIRKVQTSRMSRNAEVWELVTDGVEGYAPAPGWLQGMRQAFISLGPMAGEIYELLIVEGNPGRGRKRRKRPTGKGIPRSAALSTAEIALRTGYSPSQVKEVLAALTGWDLAAHVPRSKGHTGGWIAGKADPNRVAALLGADEIFERRRQVYARQRARWWAWLERPRQASTVDPAQRLIDIDIAATAPPDDAWMSPLVDVPAWAIAAGSADTG